MALAISRLTRRTLSIDFASASMSHNRQSCSGCAAPGTAAPTSSGSHRSRGERVRAACLRDTLRSACSGPARYYFGNAQLNPHGGVPGAFGSWSGRHGTVHKIGDPFYG